MMPIATCYQMRFTDSAHSRRKLWGELCKYFQRYVPAGATVMDIGAGYCEFINAIRARKKYAVDINPDTLKFAASGVTVLSTSALTIPKRLNGTIDRIFLSNFLEHLKSKEEVLTVLVRAHQLLAPAGKLLILQPNIDLVRERYWDFFDHTVALNTGSLKEGLAIAGFAIEEFVERFLPYTTKSFLPAHPTLVRFYLMLPEFLRPLAGQSFVVARKREKR